VRVEATERWRPAGAARLVSALILSFGLSGCGASSTKDANPPAGSLKAYLAQFYGSTHSAPFTDGRRTISIAILSPRGPVRQPATAYVLAYGTKGWERTQRIGLVDYLFPGEDRNGSARRIKLDAHTEAVAFTLLYASATAGLVVARLEDGTWSLVPFGAQRKLLVENAVFHSGGHVSSTGRLCHPDCARSKRFSVTYRFDRRLRRFVISR